MKNNINNPIFKPVAKISKASIKSSSPYPDAKAAFNWLNVDFPYIHTHNHWEIFVVLSGKMKHTLNGYSEICNRGYACLIRPTDAHSIEYSDENHNLQFINFTFSNETAKSFFNFYGDCAPELDKLTPLSFSLENSVIESIYNQALITQSANKQLYEQYSILIVHQLLCAYLFQQLSSNITYPKWLNDFLFFLHNPKTFTLTTQQLAAYTSYSYSHLARIFKQYVGQTLIDYINGIKVLYVKRLLRTTQKSVLDISLEVGFHSVSSLNHLFKELTSLTPSQYRKKHQSKQTKNA